LKEETHENNPTQLLTQAEIEETKAGKHQALQKGN